MGQINHFILLFFILWYYFYLRKIWASASFFLSLSLLFKLSPICLPLIFIARKNWLSLKYLLIFSALLLFFSFSFLPRPVFFSFFQIIPVGLAHTASNSYYYNQSLPAMAGRLFGPQIWPGLLLVVSVLLAAFFAILKSKSVNLQFSLLVTAGVLIFPLTWQHQLVYLFAPLIITFFTVKNNYKHLLFLLVSYLLIVFNIPDAHPFMSSFWGNILLSHATLGTLILFALNLRYNLKKLISLS